MAEATAPATGQPAAPAAPAEENRNDLGQPIAAPAWRDALPEAIRGEKTLEKFKDAAALAQSYINLEKMPRGVTQPKDGAPQEEWDAFYERLGRPKTAAEYGVSAKVPEGLPWNTAAETQMLEKMHKHGLTPRQAQGILDDYLALANEGVIFQAQERARGSDEALAEIRKEWGGLTADNLALVQRTVSEFGGEDFKVYLEETGLGNDPRFLKFAYAMGRPMLEDGLIRGENLGMRREDAQAEIAKIMSTKEYMAGDKALIARIQTLYPLAHGE